MTQRVQTHCTECNTTGRIIPPKYRCKACNGTKVTKIKKVHEVTIERGARRGQDIKLKGEADQAPNCIPGDVIFRISEIPHPKFKRVDNDLICEQKIDLYTTLAGGEFELLHISKKIIKGTIGPGDITSPICHKVVRNEGMPKYTKHQTSNQNRIFGDLIIRFVLVLPKPTEINYDNIDKLKSIISVSPPSPIPSSAKLQRVTVDLHDYVERPKSHSEESANYVNDDDQSHESSHIQCAQQ